MNFDIKNIKWVKGWKNLPEAYLRIKTPGVTSVISEMIPDPEYEAWVLKVGQTKVDEIMTAAGQRGTSMHFFFRKLYSDVCQNEGCIRSSCIHSNNYTSTINKRRSPSI